MIRSGTKQRLPWNWRSITKLEVGFTAGEGAFYGPKIEFSLKDCIGRVWAVRADPGGFFHAGSIGCNLYCRRRFKAGSSHAALELYWVR